MKSIPHQKEKRTPEGWQPEQQWTIQVQGWAKLGKIETLRLFKIFQGVLFLTIVLLFWHFGTKQPEPNLKTVLKRFTFSSEAVL